MTKKTLTVSDLPPLEPEAPPEGAITNIDEIIGLCDEAKKLRTKILLYCAYKNGEIKRLFVGPEVFYDPISNYLGPFNMDFGLSTYVSLDQFNVGANLGLQRWLFTNFWFATGYVTRSQAAINFARDKKAAEYKDS